MTQDKNLYGCTVDDLKGIMKAAGAPSFRADQLFRWLFYQHVEEIGDMNNVPASLRNWLTQQGYHASLPKVASLQRSEDGRTVKCALSLRDGHRIETVLMRYHRKQSRDRNTVCVSSQVGCAMGCPFCATGHAGFTRNLSAAEIVGQIVRMNELLRNEPEPGRVTNVVYMGMGEPLQNYAEVLQSIRVLHARDGMDIGWRRITLSTCGIVPEIHRLATEALPITLAVSLHSATDAGRDRLVPVNRMWGLSELIDACHAYYRATGRKITFEYTLIEGENDRAEDIQALKRLLFGLHCNVNVIPLNPVAHSELKRSGAAQRFAASLNRAGIEAMVREEMGSRIDAACGQLAGTKGDQDGDSVNQ